MLNKGENMHINSTTQTQSKPNFGMAIHSNEFVNYALQTRIKRFKDLNRLKKVIEAQEKNDRIDINLIIMPDGKSICANSYSVKNGKCDNKYFKQHTENALTKLFLGPVGFLERLAKIADKQAKKLKKADAIENSDVFDKLK